MINGRCSRAGIFRCVELFSELINDHIEGILFTELLKPVKRRMVRRKLNKIRKGKVKVDYSMKFAE